MLRSRLSLTRPAVRGHWPTALLILGLALGARLWQIDLTRFFNDQVAHIQSAAMALDSGQLPLTSGFTFAAGTTGAVIRIPALITYILVPAVAVSHDPVWVSAYVAGLSALGAPLTYAVGTVLTGRRAVGIVAGVLFALNPAALLYGRMIWNPNLAPLFAALALLGLVDFCVHARSWSLALSLLAIGCAAQLHVVNAIFFPLWLAVAAIHWRKLRAVPVIAGVGALLVSAAPYLLLQTQSGWLDARNLLAYLGRSKVADLEAVDQALAEAGAATYSRLWPAAGETVRAFHYDALTWALVALAIVGLGLLVWQHRSAGLVVVGWALLPILGSLRHTGTVVPHYVLAVLPAVAVLQGVGLVGGAALMQGSSLRKIAPRLAVAVGVALGVWLAVDYAGFQRRASTDVVQTEFGAPLRYSLAAARAVEAHPRAGPLHLAVPALYDHTIPALAGKREQRWNWGKQVLVFPRQAELYVAENDSVSFDLLARYFGPAVATIDNSAGLPVFGLFDVPQGGETRMFGGPAFVPLDLDLGGAIRLRGYETDGLAAGKPSQVRLLWQVEDAAKVPGDLNQFAHLVDASGAVVSTNTDLFDVREPWLDGDVVASELDLQPRPDAPTGGYWLETGFYETFGRTPVGSTARSGPLKLAGTDAARGPAGQPLATFGDGELALLAARWQGPDVAVDWQAPRKPAANYTVFVHAVDGSGSLVAQWDGLPRSGSYPTTLWDPGETVHDVYPLGLSPARGVHLEIGLYTQPDIRRLPVLLTSGGPPTDRVTVEAVT